MSTTWVIIIIVLVLGVVVGNITLLKYSARFKFPTPSKPFDEDKDNDLNETVESSPSSAIAQNEVQRNAGTNANHKSQSAGTSDSDSSNPMK
ncbi:DUF2897 family protein [Alteromonas sp. S015]|uniref:DUF2897 family protein n=1 Tax=Alteromonas sp. S015 TaxID=3117401 RepID=UPI002FE0DF4F